MAIQMHCERCPWDSLVFGTDAYEVLTVDRETMEKVTRTSGHFTVRTDPLASKELLHEYGFYYCDTLIEPYCEKRQFIEHPHPLVATNREMGIDQLMAMCHGAFAHGRFHRDFSVSKEQANRRYDNWLAQLHGRGKVHGLLYDGEPAGFIAVEGNRLILHAVTQSFRGKGLAKFLWTPICRMVFVQGYNEVSSSISNTNLAALHLYSSLGFRFRKPIDLYHRMIK